MKYYILRYSGPFGFIKPWTAVRDASGGETYSQQFLTPSIIEGLRQKLEVTAILRHKLVYGGIDIQQEMVQAKAWSKKAKKYIQEGNVTIASLDPAYLGIFGDTENGTGQLRDA